MTGVSVTCYVSSYKPPETSQTPTLLALLRETSHVLLCFNSTLRFAWFKCPVATAKAKLRYIWWWRRFWQRPLTSLAPKFWCYIIRRFGSLGGNLAHHLLQESLSVCFSKFLCSSEVSPRVEFINLLIVHCFSYHHSALHKLNVYLNLRCSIPKCLWNKRWEKFRQTQQW